MKNFIPQFSTAIVALVALSFLMGYTKPAADEPKQYIVVMGETNSKFKNNIQELVSEKLAEGWHLQGGVTYANPPSSFQAQAMVK